jgi:hypothetical protein
MILTRRAVNDKDKSAQLLLIALLSNDMSAEIDINK